MLEPLERLGMQAMAHTEPHALGLLDNFCLGLLACVYFLDGIPSRLNDKLMKPNFSHPKPQPTTPHVFFDISFLADLKLKVKTTKSHDIINLNVFAF